ncbi:MAG: YbjN domain-containing protein [Candidatus Nanopelagicales bacterium]|nr:YbjN domain-containing protein [Candidatus Nanopelagicales bacterium]
MADRDLGTDPTARGIDDLIERYADQTGLALERPEIGQWVVILPGEQKLRTTVLFALGSHAVSVNAFVIRAPDENREAFYRRLLENNCQGYVVAYCLDHLGDVYLVGRLAVGRLDEEELDRILGSIATMADGAFNALLELGFSSAIRREWQWRLSRGEPTTNLTAFAHLAQPSQASVRQDEVP